MKDHLQDFGLSMMGTAGGFASAAMLEAYIGYDPHIGILTAVLLFVIGILSIQYSHKPEGAMA